MAVIAAILVNVAINIVETKHFLKYYSYEKTGFFIALAVAFITIVEDPIVGMLFGTAIALLLFVEKISHGQFDITLNRFDRGLIKRISGEKITKLNEEAEILLYSIRGKLCYINSRAHISRFENDFDKFEFVILRLREVYFIDLDGVEAIDEIIEILESRGISTLITSTTPEVDHLLTELSAKYRHLKESGLVFDKSEKAFEYLRRNTPKVIN